MPRTHLDQGDIAPDFEADTTIGRIRFHDFIDGRWVLFTTHPTVFTGVCSTELVSEAREISSLEERGAVAITISEGTTEEHTRWVAELAEASGVPIEFPIISDPDFAIAAAYGVDLPRTGRDHALTRTAFLIDPTKTVRWVVTYPPRTGRNFREVLRVLDSLQIIDAINVSTPADWTNGESVLITTKESTDAASERLGTVDTSIPYVRKVDPSAAILRVQAGAAGS